MKGIVVASDVNQEWLLSWWWRHYSKHNRYPVAFFDFGMSKEARIWCEERGSVYSLPESTLKEVSEDTRVKWENRYGRGIWRFRSAWFKKPLAFLHAPFDLNIWLDLDCEVMGNLEVLFAALEPTSELALVREIEEVQEKDQKQNYLLPGEISYNSGVIVFRRGAEILSRWVEAAGAQNNRFLGDQSVLSRLIYLYDVPVTDLPLKFNWLKHFGSNPEALIVHYIQAWKLELMKLQ